MFPHPHCQMTFSLTDVDLICITQTLKLIYDSNDDFYYGVGGEDSGGIQVRISDNLTNDIKLSCIIERAMFGLGFMYQNICYMRDYLAKDPIFFHPIIIHPISNSNPTSHYAIRWFFDLLLSYNYVELT